MNKKEITHFLKFKIMKVKQLLVVLILLALGFWLTYSLSYHKGQREAIAKFNTEYVAKQFFLDVTDSLQQVTLQLSKENQTLVFINASYQRALEGMKFKKDTIFIPVNQTVNLDSLIGVASPHSNNNGINVQDTVLNIKSPLNLNFKVSDSLYSIKMSLNFPPLSLKIDSLSIYNTPSVSYKDTTILGESYRSVMFKNSNPHLSKMNVGMAFKYITEERLKAEKRKQFWRGIQFGSFSTLGLGAVLINYFKK